MSLRDIMYKHNIKERMRREKVNTRRNLEEMMRNKPKERDREKDMRNLTHSIKKDLYERSYSGERNKMREIKLRESMEVQERERREKWKREIQEIEPEDPEEKKYKIVATLTLAIGMLGFLTANIPGLLPVLVVIVFALIKGLNVHTQIMLQTRPDIMKGEEYQIYETRKGFGLGLLYAGMPLVTLEMIGAPVLSIGGLGFLTASLFAVMGILIYRGRKLKRHPKQLTGKMMGYGTGMLIVLSTQFYTGMGILLGTGVLTYLLFKKQSDDLEDKQNHKKTITGNVSEIPNYLMVLNKDGKLSQFTLEEYISNKVYTYQEKLGLKPSNIREFSKAMVEGYSELYRELEDNGYGEEIRAEYLYWAGTLGTKQGLTQYMTETYGEGNFRILREIRDSDNENETVTVLGVYQTISEREDLKIDEGLVNDLQDMIRSLQDYNEVIIYQANVGGDILYRDTYKGIEDHIERLEKDFERIKGLIEGNHLNYAELFLEYEEQLENTRWILSSMPKDDSKLYREDEDSEGTM